ncbi:hypothetical protein BJY04DRAFT_185619 [Aspergillus karnatakaensis]|uniref:WW domain-containing protein n=1 Tax=Aspergillus karnatakaensis TaxID=1810916 RepID=UPI003CCDBC4D
MSESSNKAAPRGEAPSQSPQAEANDNTPTDPTVTTQSRKQEEEEEEHTRNHDSAQKQAESDGNDDDEEEEGERQESESEAPPLPNEIPPPLPNEAPPSDDDGWEPVWDATAQSYYFYNRYTGVSQWENPRVPNSTAPAPVSAPTGALEPAIPPAPGTEDVAEKTEAPLGGYNPAIHGDYDPTAPYAQHYERQEEDALGAPGMVNPAGYEAVGSFNRFTGKWQGDSQNPDYHNDENKSRRQMNAYFDVDAAANSHDGRSLRAERSAKKLSKKELKMFKEKRREKKEEKRRAWLRD